MENFPARAPRLIASDIDGTLLDRNHRVRVAIVTLWRGRSNRVPILRFPLAGRSGG